MVTFSLEVLRVHDSLIVCCRSVVLVLIGDCLLRHCLCVFDIDLEATGDDVCKKIFMSWIYKCLVVMLIIQLY